MRNNEAAKKLALKLAEALDLDFTFIEMSGTRQEENLDCGIFVIENAYKTLETVFRRGHKMKDEFEIPVTSKTTGRRRHLALIAQHMALRKVFDLQKHDWHNEKQKHELTAHVINCVVKIILKFDEEIAQVDSVDSMIKKKCEEQKDELVAQVENHMDNVKKQVGMQKDELTVQVKKQIDKTTKRQFAIYVDEFLRFRQEAKDEGQVQRYQQETRGFAFMVGGGQVMQCKMKLLLYLMWMISFQLNAQEYKCLTALSFFHMQGFLIIINMHGWCCIWGRMMNEID